MKHPYHHETALAKSHLRDLIGVYNLINSFPDIMYITM